MNTVPVAFSDDIAYKVTDPKLGSSQNILFLSYMSLNWVGRAISPTAPPLSPPLNISFYAVVANKPRPLRLTNQYVTVSCSPVIGGDASHPSILSRISLHGQTDRGGGELFLC
ncbi:hypothetical protein ElyMa_001675300 [Elysia marginata]|uniref:Uncharacterized protein n=1 Tax=Elysia marginata TaxID=1093978 RepID=A0AAV4JTB3_9GAST|nr:hypothetical protein ElyMa_001675300 [Elysia marginata]